MVVSEWWGKNGIIMFVLWVCGWDDDDDEWG